MKLLLRAQVIEVPDEYREAFTAGSLPAHVGHDQRNPLLGMAVEFEEIKPRPTEEHKGKDVSGPER